VVNRFQNTSRPRRCNWRIISTCPYGEGFSGCATSAAPSSCRRQLRKKSDASQKLTPSRGIQGRQCLAGTTTRSCAGPQPRDRAVWRATPVLRSVFRLASPPVRYSNVYGIDMPTRNELIANGRTDQKSRARSAADALNLSGSRRHGGVVPPATRRFSTSTPRVSTVATSPATSPGLPELRRSGAQRRNSAASALSTQQLDLNLATGS